MKNPLKSAASASFGLLLARLPIGALFMMAGVMKFTGDGLTAFVNGSIGASKPFMPEALGRAYLYALPFVEFLVGALIFAGWFARISALLASLILLSIMMAVTGARTPEGGFNGNVFMFIMTAMLIFTGPGGASLEKLWPRGRKAPSKAE